MISEDLTKRIVKAEKETKRRSYLGKDWWRGYVWALKEIREGMDVQQ